MYAVSPTVRAVFFVVCARAFVPAYLLDVTRRTEEVHRLSQRDRLCDDAAARRGNQTPCSWHMRIEERGSSESRKRPIPTLCGVRERASCSAKSAEVIRTSTCRYFLYLGGGEMWCEGAI